MKKIFLKFLFLFLISFNCFCQTTNITVGWIPSKSLNVGYYIYYDLVKNMPTRNTIKIDAGTNTTLIISNINTTMSYYMYATSYFLNNNKLESIPSNTIQIFKSGHMTILHKK